VRELERQIAGVCRKVARKLVSSNQKTVKITAASIEKYLGTKKIQI